MPKLSLVSEQFPKHLPQILNAVFETSVEAVFNSSKTVDELILSSFRNLSNNSILLPKEFNFGHFSIIAFTKASRHRLVDVNA